MKLARINTLLILLAVAAGAYFLSSREELKIGYFDGNEVFTEFQMTKDLEGQMEATANARTQILDSLRFGLESMQRQLQSVEQPEQGMVQMFEAKRQEFMMKQNQFDTESANQSAQYNDQIFQQLRQYVDDFKSEHHYDLLIGLGSGGIVSTSEGVDVSKSLREFINQKYKGS